MKHINADFIKAKKYKLLWYNYIISYFPLHYENNFLLENISNSIKARL